MKKIVMLSSALAVLMSACVVVPPDHDRGARGGDRDRDGVPNRVDRDRDGDGTPNRHDRRPNDPDRR